LNRGPHRPELWAKYAGVAGSACKSVGSGASSPPLRSSDIAGDCRGLGSEIELLPNGDAGTGAELSRNASTRAAAHVANSRLTVLGAGHSPRSRRSSASPPRRRACVRDQSYDDATARSAHAKSTSPRPPARGSSVARSHRDGIVCSRRMSPPFRCAATCTRHSRGTPRRSEPSPRVPSRRSGPRAPKGR
jgi:hypothetical protein